MFSALVKLLVRELRSTERTNVIVLYLGSVSSLGAAIACTVLPSGFVVPTQTAQYSYLLGTGRHPRHYRTEFKSKPLSLTSTLSAQLCVCVF